MKEYFLIKLLISVVFRVRVYFLKNLVNFLMFIFPLPGVIEGILYDQQPHFLLRSPNKKKKIEEESKEILVSKADLELENSEMLYQVEDLKAKANEFKIVYLEILKYKEQVEILIIKKVVRKTDDEKMHFLK